MYKLPCSKFPFQQVDLSSKQVYTLFSQYLVYSFFLRTFTLHVKGKAALHQPRQAATLDPESSWLVRHSCTHEYRQDKMRGQSPMCPCYRKHMLHPSSPQPLPAVPSPPNIPPRCEYACSLYPLRIPLYPLTFTHTRAYTHAPLLGPPPRAPAQPCFNSLIPPPVCHPPLWPASCHLPPPSSDKSSVNP